MKTPFSLLIHRPTCSGYGFIIRCAESTDRLQCYNWKIKGMETLLFSILTAYNSANYYWYVGIVNRS